MDKQNVKKWLDELHPAAAKQLIKDARSFNVKRGGWPNTYTNKKTKKVYAPHNADEEFFVYSDTPRFKLLKGGEGAGKSVAGIIKNLDRLRRGMDGIMVSPDLQHFKKSLWPEFVRWCPWDRVVEKHQYRQYLDWEPSGTFSLVFNNDLGGQSVLMCGGIKESEIRSWEGPNVSFGHIDEVRRHRTPEALKVLDGRVRIPGPKGEPPELYFTTTPRKHWLFEYFGPLESKEDKLRDFKRSAFTGTVLTEENKDNLSEGFTEQRALSLNESERRIHLLAEWEDEQDVEKFVNMIWWDRCRAELPPLQSTDLMILSMDAAKGGVTSVPDSFAVVGTTRHPTQPDVVVVRYVRVWDIPPHTRLDFQPIENEIRQVCKDFSIVEIPYDESQLHDMATRLRREGVAYTKPFSQMSDRLKSDRLLQQLIMQGRLMHDGNPVLRSHIDNADIKKQGGAIRIVKRVPSLKVDAAIALSQAVARTLYYIS